MNKRMTSQRQASRWLAAACVLALQACGGGGDDASAAPAPAPPDGVLSSCNLPNFGAEVLKRINDVRAAGANCGAKGVLAPTGPLVWNTQLTRAADGHSQDMSAANYFSHTSADGRVLRDRINASGYSWSLIGENIAAGQPTVNTVMDGWIASDDHCANLMQPHFKDVGVSCVPGTASSRYRTYWTMNLGAPR